MVPDRKWKKGKIKDGFCCLWKICRSRLSDFVNFIIQLHSNYFSGMDMKECEKKVIKLKKELVKQHATSLLIGAKHRSETLRKEGSSAVRFGFWLLKICWTPEQMKRTLIEALVFRRKKSMETVRAYFQYVWKIDRLEFTTSFQNVKFLFLNVKLSRNHRNQGK